uniref:Uncharacterized protein n=1 Tax=Pithovirus LCPAC302 TaxID=2506593 RepID=A0A481Z9Z0_9VIRU|nr:MAG: uncharacterized protein LCPAC302_00810 [Pithovirus LCPAC302]
MHSIYEPGDYVEFKSFNSESHEYKLLKGQISNINDDLYEIKLYNKSGICWINPLAIIKHYPLSSISYLSMRLIFKSLWKDFIFREVKIIKTKEPYLITYQYVNDSGFVRTESFTNLPAAYRTVPVELHKNIQIHYRDFFGFTTDRPVRNNDDYSQDIFFSKKCYGELNLSGNPVTGNFSNRRGFKSVPPEKRQYICGLAEIGEKGPFYRKWFFCSKEFLTLWTMVCETDHYSLRKNIEGKYIPKTFNELTKELDTSYYDITNRKIIIEDMKKGYQVHSVENSALYLNIYLKIAKLLFCQDNVYDPFSIDDKIIKDIMWMKQSN